MIAAAVESFLRESVAAFATAPTSAPDSSDLQRGIERFTSDVGRWDSPAPVDDLASRGEARPPLPRLRVVDQLAGLDDDWSLARQFSSFASALPWVPTPRSNDGGTELALCPLDGLAPLAATAGGFILVGAGSQYPEHSHRPSEAYLVVSGTGRWRYGGSADYVPIEAGSVIANRPGDVHSVIADRSAVVALYVLWEGAR